MIDNLKELENLSSEERLEVLKIFKELSDSGISEEYNNLILQDYDEIPVDIETFLRDPKYLGKGLINEEGKFTVYTYWLNLLKEIFPDPLKPATYNTLALTGAIGLGKSFVAVLVGLYELYRMLCLKDPYIYYGLQPIDKITFAVMNITLDASKGVAWDKMQQLIQSSEWFMSRGKLSGSVNVEWTPNKNIELIAGSLSRHIIGRAVFWAFFDEVSFQPNQDVEKQKEKAKTLVNTASARMQSRFMKGSVNPTILCLASSKRTEQSYMETFIESKKNNESKTTKVVDEPQWVIREDKNSDIKFKVALGNKFLSSEVIPLDATESDVQLFIDRGFTILEVPIGYYENFIDDIDIALTDIAGISTTSSSRYIAGHRISAIKDSTIKNPFVSDVLEIGDGKDDTNQYYDFFNMELVDKSLLQYPMYVHLDMSVSGDKTGLGGVWIVGKKPPVEGQPPSKELFYRLSFMVSIKAPKGHQISFEKNRQFIYWLKENGFNIKGVSCDTYQSADLLQQLKGKGFDTEIISVDRVKDNICQPYQYLKSTIYEERLVIFEDNLLVEELIGLERNNSNGKVDHAPTGINCFTGDTEVSLVDGRTLSFIELVDEFNQGKRNFVYSFNIEKQRVEPKLITNAWCSGHNAKLVEVTLDNGEVLRCTPEHKFMLKDGTYKQAINLVSNDSLMPLYTRVSDKGLKGYRMYFEPIEGKWHYEHRMFANNVLDKKYLVHHQDCNPLNNSPDNLLWCSKQAHKHIHDKMRTGALSPEANLKRRETVTKYHAEARNSLEYWCRWHPDLTPEEAYNKHLEIECLREETLKRRAEREEYYKHNKTKREQQIDKQKKMAEYYGIDLDALQGTELQALMIKYAHDIDSTYQEKVSKAVSKRHKEGKMKNAAKALASCNEQSKMLKQLYPTVDRDIFYELFGVQYDDLSKSQRAPWTVKYRRALWERQNHRVKSVRVLDTREDVFDITVEDNHNFALKAGVFVHNSKDSADALCGAIWNASQHGEEFDFEFGETLDTIVDVSLETSEKNYKTQVTIDFEDELKKVSNSFSESLKNDKSVYTDFGLGASTTDYSMYDCLII